MRPWNYMPSLAVSVTPVAPGGHLSSLAAAARLVHESHPARMEELADAVSFREVVRTTSLVPLVDVLLNLMNWRSVGPGLTTVDRAVRRLDRLPLGRSCFSLALILGGCISFIIIGSRSASECSSGAVHELVLGEVDLQVGHRLLVLPAELPILFVHAIQKLFHALHCSFVTFLTGARDAQLQGFRAFLLASALEIARPHSSQSQFSLRLPNNAFHVRALGTDNAPRHLEIFVVLDADDKATGVLSLTLPRRLVARVRWHCPRPRRHRSSPWRPGLCRCPRRKSPSRERHSRIRSRQTRISPLDAQGPFQAVQDLAIQVVHGCLCILERLKNDDGAGASLINADLLHAPIAAEHLVQIILRELILELHSLHGDGHRRL
mmetsp:Transcript_68095/g.162540  ORF Transcript_68095/g.162540 Transcript_68095/m.162540 type:complete len:378 (+) Transcript_68095:31-1164(+)